MSPYPPGRDYRFAGECIIRGFVWLIANLILLVAKAIRLLTLILKWINKGKDIQW